MVMGSQYRQPQYAEGVASSLRFSALSLASCRTINSSERTELPFGLTYPFFGIWGRVPREPSDVSYLLSWTSGYIIVSCIEQTRQQTIPVEY
jgi:hypothetical protein